MGGPLAPTLAYFIMAEMENIIIKHPIDSDVILLVTPLC